MSGILALRKNVNMLNKTINIPFQEQQQSKQRQLSQEERQCRSYLTLASRTVEMFHYLTEKIVEPFLTPVSSVHFLALWYSSCFQNVFVLNCTSLDNVIAIAKPTCDILMSCRNLVIDLQLCWISTCSNCVVQNVKIWKCKTQKSMVGSQRSCWTSLQIFTCI